jgi:hypothetical protein
MRGDRFAAVEERRGFIIVIVAFVAAVKRDEIRRDKVRMRVVIRIVNGGLGVHRGAKRRFRGRELGPKVADLRLKSRVVGGWRR